MNKTIQKRIIVVLAFVMAFGVGMPTVATAMEREPQAKPGGSTAQYQAAPEQKAMATPQQELKDRLSGLHLKACQAREKAITGIMSRSAERGQKHITQFSMITERVEAFYVRKGKMLSNYDQLVADVATKKAAAQSAVDVTRSSLTGFTCTGDNPKGTIQMFKTKLKAQEEAMKAFRTSVKNLIVGVKSVQASEASTKGGQQ